MFETQNIVSLLQDGVHTSIFGNFGEAEFVGTGRDAFNASLHPQERPRYFS